MRRRLPTLLCTATITLAAFSPTLAQDRFAYAITDLTGQGGQWNALRKIDLGTGVSGTVLLNGGDQTLVMYDAATKQPMLLKRDARYGNTIQTPFFTGVAAAAYDKKHNRLYFTPMFVDQLRYVDLKTMKVYSMNGEGLAKSGNLHTDEAKIITRMVIAPNGSGYAISNDGYTFFRFSTGKNAEIVSLGALADDPSNGGISVHNKCSSFGGDMIADEKGNLWILTANRHVFRVNAETNVAKHIGSIQNLPATFTVNGAAVDAEGAILVSSATDGSAYYTVDPFNWTASPFKGSGTFRSSDLANSNYLPMAQRGPVKPELVNVPLTAQPGRDLSNFISVYPNPVTSNNIVLQFNKVPAGEYTIELTDIMGRTVMQKRIQVSLEAQAQTMQLSQNSARGTYLVRIVDRSNQNVFNQKVLVQ